MESESDPRGICAALLERGPGSSRGISACLSVDVLRSSKDGLLLGVVELACWAKPGSERRKTVQRRLTERRGAEAGHRAGHQGVGDLSEGQQARWVVPFPLLLLDQTLQLLLEGLEDGRRERMTETEHEEGRDRHDPRQDESFTCRMNNTPANSVSVNKTEDI